MMAATTPQGGPVAGGGGQAVAGIAKNISWKLLFFIAACCVLAAAVISIGAMIVEFEWAPFSMTTQLFLLVFGMLMIVLDFPIPHPNPYLAMVRFSIYKFLLFMTRFTGRGMWYLFLGTMIFVALFDLKISYFFGVCLSGYVGIVGLVTLIYGLQLSSKLDTVRKSLQNAPTQAPYNGWSYTGFGDLALQVNGTKFSEDELIYIFNGLSFTPSNDGVITPDEYNTWLMPGRMEII